MDGVRFDALAKAFSRSGGGGRRQVLAGLLGGSFAGLVGGLGTEAAAKKRPGKRGKQGKRGKAGHAQQDRRSAAGPPPDRVAAEKKRKPKKKTVCHEGRTIKVPKKAVKGHLAHGDISGPCPPEALCPKEPFQACMEPASAAFIAAIEPCRPQCESNVESAACQGCVAPAVEAAVAAAEACRDEVCPSGLGSAEGGAQAARRDVGAEAEPATGGCNFERLSLCMVGATGKLNVCLLTTALRACLLGAVVPGACPLAIAGCWAIFAVDSALCSAIGGGCGLDGWCTASNVCCPDRFDIGCNGTCCDPDACEQCVGGSCVGCTPPQECKGLINQTCECPDSFWYERCDETCCDRRNCEACVDGKCEFTCEPPHTFCESNGGTSHGFCKCPPSQEGCGDVCCPAGKVCCDIGAKLCCGPSDLIPGSLCCRGQCCAEGWTCCQDGGNGGSLTTCCNTAAGDLCDTGGTCTENFCQECREDDDAECCVGTEGYAGYGDCCRAPLRCTHVDIPGLGRAPRCSA